VRIKYTSDNGQCSYNESSRVEKPQPKAMFSFGAFKVLTVANVRCSCVTQEE